MVPGSTFRYGSSFCRETVRWRAFRMFPMDAAVIPLPSEETTPPVTKTYFDIETSRAVFQILPGRTPRQTFPRVKGVHAPLRLEVGNSPLEAPGLAAPAPRAPRGPPPLGGEGVRLWVPLLAPAPRAWSRSRRRASGPRA